MSSTAPDERRPLDRGWLHGLSVVLLAAVLGLPALQGLPLTLDEHVSFHASSAATPADVLRISLNQLATPPLPSLLEWISLRLLGVSETALRLPSLLAWLVAVWAMFRLGVTLGGVATGWLAALLLLGCPEVLDEVRIARPYGLVVALSILLLWQTVLARQSRPTLNGGLAWGLTAAALLWTHYFATPLVAILGLTLLASTIHRETLPAVAARRGKRPVPATSRIRLLRPVPALVAVMMPVLASVPLLPSLFRLADWSPALSFQAGTPGALQVTGPYWCVIGAVTAFLLLGLRRQAAGLPGGCSPSGWLWLWWLSPILLLCLAGWLGQGALLNPRYRLAFVPVAIAAVSIAWTSRLSVRWLLPVAAASLTGVWLVTPQPPWQVARLGAIADVEWQAAAVSLNRDTGSSRRAIFVQSALAESALLGALPDDDGLAEYAGCRLNLYWQRTPRDVGLPIGLPWFWPIPGRATGVLAERLEKAEEVWVVGSTETDLTRGSLEQTDVWLQEDGWRQESETTATTLVVRRYLR